ncbi:MAG: restriction endonuclease subunit S [Bacteroidota bacterium]
MNKNVANLCNIRSGIYKKPEPGGHIRLIRASDFHASGHLKAAAHEMNIRPWKSLAKHSLKPGDVLLTAKGESNPAFLFSAADVEAVASSMFLVLRPNNALLEAEYLFWYLNSKECQHILSTKSRGSGIPTLAKKALGEVSIPIPSLDIQKAIVRLGKLQKKEQQLYRELMRQRKHLVETNLLNLAHQH